MGAPGCLGGAGERAQLTVVTMNTAMRKEDDSHGLAVNTGAHRASRIPLAILIVVALLLAAWGVVSLLDLFNVTRAFGFGFLGANDRAHHCMEEGDLEGAIAACDRAIRLAPHFRDSYAVRGSAFEAKGCPREAIADYTEGIRLRPDDTLFYVRRGRVYERLGELDSAIKDYCCAISNCRNAQAIYACAVYHANTEAGDPVAEMVAVFDRAMRHNPNDKTISRCRDELIGARRRVVAGTAQ
jgi:tetratricopeptide (TPR) repeat protein